MTQKFEDYEDIPPVVIQKKNQDESDSIPDHLLNAENDSELPADHTNRPPRPSDYNSINNYLRQLEILKRFLLNK